MASVAEHLRGDSDVDIGDSLAIAALSLARQFARGGTLWCLAPERPEHARHVAVEFVHPVLVGKRALPAVSVDASDPVVALRSLVRSGDAILAVSRSDSPSTLAVLRRAEAWGVLTIWIGAGERPLPGSAGHILWAADDAPDDPRHDAADHAADHAHDHADDSAGMAEHDGRLVLLYHLLWELTHVCFEHPGLLAAPDECEDGEVCITCSDEGRIGEVVAIDGYCSARVRTAKGVEVIDTTIVDAEVGDLVLIHAGAGIAVVP